MRGARAKPKARFWFYVQNQPVLDSGSAYLLKKLHHEAKPKSHHGGRKSAAGSSASSTDSRKMGAMVDGVLDAIQSLTSSPSSSSIVQVGTLPKFLDQWKSITSNMFVLNMVKGNHLQVRCCPLLFHNFRHLIIKASLVHHPIIQKEVDDLLAKGANEPLTDGAGCQSNIFVFPKFTGGLLSILNLKQFNHCIHIPAFKITTIRQSWQLIQQGNYAFSVDL